MGMLERIVERLQGNSIQALLDSHRKPTTAVRFKARDNTYSSLHSIQTRLQRSR